MARFPLFGTETSGRSTRYTAQEHINVYLDVVKNADRDQITFYGRPGLELFTASLGETPVRGMHTVGSLLYVVHRGKLYSIDATPTLTDLGSLDTTSGRVCMTDNGVQLLIVDGTEGYTWNIDTTTFAKITDVDFPAATTCDYQGGFFLVDDGGSNFFVSALDDGTSWAALDFASAETFPDDIVRVYVEGGQVILFGEKSTEVWSNVGNVDFPYQHVTGAVIEWGLAAKWSVADVADAICFLAISRTGEVQAVRGRGLGIEPIGGPEFAHIINNYSTVSDATGFGYTIDGHAFWQINFPTAKESWAVSLRNGMASRMQFGTLGARHRAEIGVEWLGDVIVSDYENGSLYRIECDAFADNGVEFAKELRGRHLFGEDEIAISEIRLDFEVGVGSSMGAGENPQAMLQVSKDGGRSYQPERWKEIGKIGEYRQRVVFRRFGQAYDWVMRLRVSDPVKFVLVGAWVRT